MTQLNRAFIIGIILNVVYVSAEFMAGFYYNSMALLSDAGHNLSDVAGLGIALLAFRLAKIPANDRFTYGYKKSTVLAALANALLLFIAVGGIGWESLQRIQNPPEVPGTIISVVAFAGIIINGLTASLFFRDKEKDINIKGAYLHMALDALVSMGVVAAGLLIRFTGLYWIDPVISLIIIVVITVSTWSLLKNSLRLSLDGKPSDIDSAVLKEKILKIKGVTDIHHVHIWALSSNQNALTAHLVLSSALSSQEIEMIKKKVKHEMEHQRIHHATLETEVENFDCAEKDC